MDVAENRNVVGQQFGFFELLATSYWLLANTKNNTKSFTTDFTNATDYTDKDEKMKIENA